MNKSNKTTTLAMVLVIIFFAAGCRESVNRLIGPMTRIALVSRRPGSRLLEVLLINRKRRPQKASTRRPKIK